MEVNNFVYYNPTRIYFGNEQLVHLGEEVKKYGRQPRNPRVWRRLHQEEWSL